MDLKPILNSENPHVSVIIPVMNERRTIAAVIRECREVHPQTEVIVVANGSSDGSGAAARAAGARVITYPYPLGHDVGRSVGAAHAKGRILLFTDGDIRISRTDLRMFVHAVERGVDVALNRYSGPTERHSVHSVVLAKHTLNLFLESPGLKGVSMTTIPHALSRKAVETIGSETLSVPPKAHAMAVCKGLQVRAVHHVEVGRSNPRKNRRRVDGRDPLEALILGDHLEAVRWLTAQTGPRGSLVDRGRRREVLRIWQ